MPKVLLVDDEQEVLNMLEKLFLLEGIEVDKANSGTEGLAMHQRNLYPVVVTDINMPEMNGVDLLKKIKEIHLTSIIIVITGYTTRDNLVDCIGHGAVDFFTKPFEDTEFLVKTVADALERTRRWKRQLKK